MIEKHLKVNDANLIFRDGERGQEAIIFLHFGGANLMMWQRAVPNFQYRYRVILVDLRGHGKSDSPLTGYHMDDMAGDIVGILEHLGIGKAHLIGSSLGAEVGLSLAANYPGRVYSLVCDGALSSEFGPYGTWDGTQEDYLEYVSGFMQKLRDTPESIFPTVEALIAKRRESLAGTGWWNEYVDAMERYGTRKLGDGKYVSAFRKHAREDYFSHYFTYQLEDYYYRVHCPLLLLPGEDVFDNEREKSAMQGLCSLALKAQIARVSGWEHPYGWLIHPHEACRVVLDFLQK